MDVCIQVMPWRIRESMEGEEKDLEGAGEIADSKWIVSSSTLRGTFTTGATLYGSREAHSPNESTPS